MQCHAHANDTCADHVMHTSGEPPTQANGSLNSSLGTTIRLHQCTHQTLTPWTCSLSGSCLPHLGHMDIGKLLLNAFVKVGPLYQGTTKIDMCSSRSIKVCNHELPQQVHTVCGTLTRWKCQQKYMVKQHCTLKNTCWVNGPFSMPASKASGTVCACMLGKRGGRLHTCGHCHRTRPIPQHAMYL